MAGTDALENAGRSDHEMTPVVNDPARGIVLDLDFPD